MQLLLSTPSTRVIDGVDAAVSVRELYDAVARAHGLPMARHYLVHHGARLPPDGAQSLSQIGVRGGDVVRVVPRLVGGGGDGGAYPPTATELKWMNDIGGGSKRGSWAVLGGSVRRTQFEKISVGLQRYESCATCALSGEALKSPVVACALGMLYNKEALIEALLAKATRPLDERFAHIRSLKDVHSVTLHTDPEHDAQGAATSAAAGTDGAQQRAPFHCPVTKLPFNGRLPFFAVRPSGHVVSERALAMMEFKVCPVTEQPLAPAAPAAGSGGPSELPSESRRFHLSADLLPLVLTDDELEYARSRLDEARAAATSKRKGDGSGHAGKRAKHGSSGADARQPAQAPAAAAAASHAAGGSAAAGKAPVVNMLAASRAATHVQQAVSKQAQESDVYKSLFVTKESKQNAARVAQGGRDFMTRSITLPAKQQPAPDAGRG